MFKKKPALKNLSPLRSSDRRKIADQIINDYKIPVPASAPAEGSGEQGNETEPSSTAPTLSSIRNAILPESSLTARFNTTAGPDLHEVQGTVYVGRHSESEGERILWVRLESTPNARLYPTVYTLWHNPRIVPLLHTPGLVVQKLYGGADLMIPGLANGPPFPEGAVKGSVVAVASLDKPDVPVFVGVCEIDVSALQDVRGARGHAVRGIHWDGDEVWGWSSSGRPGHPAPDSLPEWNGDIEEVGDGVGGLALEDKNDEKEEPAGGVSLSGGGGDDSKVPEPSTKEIDAAFHNAFVYALYQHRKDNPSVPNHGIEFPIQPSALISNYITPYLPIYSPEEAQYYQLKKTSWKNVKKFVKQLDKEKLIKSKDRSGGETVILDADFNDVQVERFVPYRLPSKNGTAKTTPDPSQSAASGNDPSIGQTITLQSLFRPNEKLTPELFPSLPHGDIKNHYPYSEASKHLNNYLSSDQHSPPLISPKNPRIITLNDFFRSRVFTSKSANDTSILARGTVTRDALLKRIVEDPTLCSPYHLLTINPKTPSTQQKPAPKPKSGHPPKITITIERRTGTKVATRVVGLEVFGIVPSLLADELQKKCASSTSVAQANAAVKGVMEVFVQGDQRKVLETVLERRGVKKGWVEVVDKTKKGKK